MTEVFELTYHGGGGFTYSEAWNMDVPKRRFNLKKINEYLEKVEEANNQDNQKITERTDPKSIKVPEFIKNNQEKAPFVSKVKAKR